ncbi:MAG: SDR family oxidoreductase, partial [Proteobacteria bacterium]|nr:SDR family oxidoreductase [Pseudomonadota bacterium]
MQVFLTGGTGFLGSAVIPFLVADSRTEKIHVLVRDSLRENASVRIAKLVERLFSPEHRSLAKLKLVPVVGDLTQLKMGLSEFDYNALATVCTHVLHVGASTDFGAPLGESRLINVEGTRCVLDFATDIKTRNQHFVRFDYVSTAYVAGTKRGLVDEQTLVRGQKFANFYEQSKYEAEVLVRSYMEKIPISIQRPSIVVGDSRNGFTPHFKVLYWPLLLLSKNILPFIPCNPMAMLDIVPVDFVARGIYGLMMNQRSIGQTYHLTAGPENTLRIKAFLDDAFRLTSIQRRPLMPLTMFQLLRSRLFKPMMSQSFWEACDLAAVYSEYI